ncbi:MAG: Bug family tripartite tricarboxylate transporter substrate binding protein [Micrococcaceae bacterium]
MTTNRMKKLTVITLASGLTFGLAACGNGEPGEYPDHNIDYIIPFGTGGSTDPIGREFTRMLGEELGTSFIVENMPGGDQTIGTAKLLSSEPDGYTLGLGTPAGLMVQPQINPDVPYSGLEDAQPIIKMMSGPYVLVVDENSEFDTLEDFLSAAEAEPGSLRVGTTARISDNSFALILLEDEAGVETTMVPFTEGAGEAVLSLKAGDIDAAVVTAGGQKGMIDAGSLKPLAHTGPSEFNDVVGGAPSMEEAGFDVPFASEFMTLAPAGLPDDVYETLVTAAESVGQSEEWLDWLENQALVPDVLVGDELDQFLVDMEEANARALQLLEERDD